MTTRAAETPVKDPTATARDLARGPAREAAERDTERRFPHAEMKMLRSSGLAALRVPKEYGGLGADVPTLCAVLSALGEGLEWSGDWHLARIHPPVNSHF